MSNISRMSEGLTNIGEPLKEAINRVAEVGLLPIKKERKKRSPKKATSNKHTYELVELHWYDAEVEGDWADYDPTITPAAPVCITVGFLIKETADVLVIASTYSDKQTNARIKIPRAFLKSYKTLHLKEME